MLESAIGHALSLLLRPRPPPAVRVAAPAGNPGRGIPTLQAAEV